jgi:hypothetical protein
MADKKIGASAAGIESLQQSVLNSKMPGFFRFLFLTQSKNHICCAKSIPFTGHTNPLNVYIDSQALGMENVTMIRSDCFTGGKIPSVADLPKGLVKASAVAIWLIALIAQSTRMAVPTRLLPADATVFNEETIII